MLGTHTHSAVLEIVDIRSIPESLYKYLKDTTQVTHKYEESKPQYPKESDKNHLE